MQTCDGLVVEESTFDQWLVSAFIAAHRAVPKARCSEGRKLPRPHSAPPRSLAGARVLYWAWLAGTVLALAIH